MKIGKIKINKNILSSLLLVSLIVTLISYFTVVNLTLVIVILIFGVIFSFIGAIKTAKYQVDFKRFKECLQFCDKFIISISFKKTLLNTLESCYSVMSEEALLLIKENATDQKVLYYLNNYYNFEIYKMFLICMDGYFRTGIDVLFVCESLMKQIGSIRSYLSKSKKANISSILNFIILWSVTLLIMVIARFSLSSFYTKMNNSFSYNLVLTLCYLFFFLSVFIFTNSLCDKKIMGELINEKI